MEVKIELQDFINLLMRAHNIEVEPDIEVGDGPFDDSPQPDDNDDDDNYSFEALNTARAMLRLDKYGVHSIIDHVEAIMNAFSVVTKDGDGAQPPNYWAARTSLVKRLAELNPMAVSAWKQREKERANP